MCSHSYRPRHDGIIRDDRKYISRFFFFFQVTINHPRVIGPLSRKHRAYRPFTLTDRMLRSAYCVKAGKFTDDTCVRYTRRGLVIRQRSAYRSVTNSGTTRPDRSGSRKRPELESHVHDAARHRLRFTRQVMIPLRGTETVKISSSFGRVRRRMYVRTVTYPRPTTIMPNARISSADVACSAVRCRRREGEEDAALCPGSITEGIRAKPTNRTRACRWPLIPAKVCSVLPTIPLSLAPSSPLPSCQPPS